jgi:hypothetical protein
MDFVMQAPMVLQIEDYRDSVEQDQKMKPRLYHYPNWSESVTVFDYEDLVVDAFLVLCVRAQIGVPGHEHDQHKVFVWRGPEFEEEDSEGLIESGEFVEKVMEQYWGCRRPGEQFNIQVVSEQFGMESDEFYDYF